jgi:hypothetical protein
MSMATEAGDAEPHWSWRGEAAAAKKRDVFAQTFAAGREQALGPRAGSSKQQ